MLLGSTVFGTLVLLAAVPVHACIIQVKPAGRNPGYLYAAAHIDGLLNADGALKRISNLPLVDMEKSGTLLTTVTDGLTKIEIAAREFECAASVVQQERFPSGEGDLNPELIEFSALVSRAAHEVFLKLARTARGFASLIKERMKGKLDQVELAGQMAQLSADFHENMKAIFETTASIPHILVDPNPDKMERLSRLQITAKERDDLIKMLDQGFGSRARKQKGDRPALDAGVALLRDWLATSGHTAKP
jgi:hypothetical protein